MRSSGGKLRNVLQYSSQSTSVAYLLIFVKVLLVGEEKMRSECLISPWDTLRASKHVCFNACIEDILVLGTTEMKVNMARAPQDSCWKEEVRPSTVVLSKKWSTSKGYWMSIRQTLRFLLFIAYVADIQSNTCPELSQSNTSKMSPFLNKWHCVLLALNWPQRCQRALQHNSFCCSHDEYCYQLLPFFPLSLGSFCWVVQTRFLLLWQKTDSRTECTEQYWWETWEKKPWFGDYCSHVTKLWRRNFMLTRMIHSGP